MSDSFLITINRTKNNTSESNIMSTTARIVTIGNDLSCSIRIREPSIEKVHLQINFDKMTLFVSGKDVFLNDTGLEVGKTYNFTLGDTIKIHDCHLTISKSDSNAEITGAMVIKPFPNYLEETIPQVNEKEVESKEVIIQKEIETNQFIKGDVLYQEVVEKVHIEEKVFQGEDLEESGMRVEDGSTKKVNSMNESMNESMNVDESIKGNGGFDKSINVDEGFDKQIDQSMNVDESIKANEGFDKQIDINSSTNTNPPTLDSSSSIKDVLEIQQAVKILDDDQKVETALEDNDLTTFKEAITLKKDDLNSEIRETIEPEISLTDTPIDPTMTKRVVKDLGEVVLEKEILSDAEKIVDEKLGNDEDDNNVVNGDDQEVSKVGKLEDNMKDGEFEDKESKDNVQEHLQDNEEEIVNVEEQDLQDLKDEQDNVESEPKNTTTKTKTSSTKPKKETKSIKPISTPSASFISRTPRRAASQVSVDNPLLTPIPKRTKRNSTIPKGEEKKTGRNKK